MSWKARNIRIKLSLLIIIIIILMKYLKTLSSFEISSPFVQRRGDLLCQSDWENHGNSWLTSTKTQVVTERKKQGGVRHDPQRFMGKTVPAPHFNRDTVEFASLERDESNLGIKTLLPFLKKVTEQSDLENFQDLMVALDACYWLHKAISIGLSRFGDDRRCHKSSRF